jgi:hypothetical protein
LVVMRSGHSSVPRYLLVAVRALSRRAVMVLYLADACRSTL